MKKLGISTKELISRYPLLYHMAEGGSWPGIWSSGLRSTSSLLDLYEVTGQERERIESQHRPRSVTIDHPRIGRAVIRDQQPMSDESISRALRDGFTPRDWYEILNRHVFFWLTEDRLRTLLGARLYRGRRHTILLINTARLLEKVGDRVVLSPLNTGASRPFPPQPRGRNCFLPLDQYPFAEWNDRRRGRDPIVELSVRGEVLDVGSVVEQAISVGGGDAAEEIWPVERARRPEWD